MSDTAEETRTTNKNSQNADLHTHLKCDFCEVKKSLLQDRPFIIAMFLIFSFVILYTIVIAFKPDLASEVGTIWGAWIGGAIGYFFGSRPVDELIKRMDEIVKFTKGLLDDKAEQLKIKEEQLEKRTKEVEEYLKFMYKSEDELEDISNLRANYQKSIEDLKTIITNYKDKLPQDLIEKLKADYLL